MLLLGRHMQAWKCMKILSYSYEIPDTYARIIVHGFKNCLIQINLIRSRCRAQCYDRASNMTGHSTRVASQVLSMGPKALFTHCFGHSLNQAVCDTIKQCKLTKDILDVHGL